MDAAITNPNQRGSKNRKAGIGAQPRDQAAAGGHRALEGQVLAHRARAQHRGGNPRVVTDLSGN